MHKDGDAALPISTPTGYAASSAARKEAASDSAVLGRRRSYKFWALAAILLLAFWSMLTGTVTLRWSAGNLHDGLSDDLYSHVHDDLDVLEMEEREKTVNHMWDVYTNSQMIKLPRFWQEAFEAAYEELTSDAPGVREGAISEIAKMSLSLIDFELPTLQSSSIQELRLKQAVKGNNGATSGGTKL